MTIKELENRTGMARANIRFYEGEGLLTPKRLDNGYRDYSEEDARTLEKIKLLRQLQLDIDTIRKVQQGALTLEQAVFIQTTKLEGDKALIERATEVCRGIESSGVEYAALEPQPWLAQLQAPQRPGLPETQPTSLEDLGVEEWDGEYRACDHPWMRLFARNLDMTLYSTLYEGLWMLLFWDQKAPLSTGILSGLFLLAFTLAVEPLWLHYVGWTPGKLLFGLKVRNKNKEKLTLAQGYERSWAVFREGYGWGIPFCNLWAMWQGYKLSREGQDCWWDTDLCFRYTQVERCFHTGVVYVVLALACTGALWGVKELTDLPRNRGDLTVAEFCQNYNQYRGRFKELGFDNVPKLDREGQWDEQGQNNNVASHGGSVSYNSSDGTMYTIEDVVEGTRVWMPLEFTLEDGRVTAVTLHMESQDSIISPSVIREYLVLAAMSGAADGQDMFHFEALDGLFEMSDLDYFEDLELDYWGLHISQRVEYEGYNSVGSSMWETEEDGPRHFERTLTISLPEQ